jgi:hypothetical protein
MTYNVVALFTRDLVHQRCNCKVWYRHNFGIFASILRDDALNQWSIGSPVWWWVDLATMSSIVDHNRVVTLDPIIWTGKTLECLDYIGTFGLLVKKDGDLLFWYREIIGKVSFEG